MKAFALTLLGMVCAFSAVAQVKNQGIDLVCEVTQKVAPDLLNIQLNLNYSDKQEQNALNLLTSGIDEQTRSIEKAGIPREKIKLSQFNLSEQYNFDNGKRTQTGYVATQSISISIPASDKALIGRLLKALTVNKKESVTMNIEAVVSDELNAKVRNELIAKAVFDAKNKATIVAQSLGVQLGYVESVQYGGAFDRIENRETLRFASMKLSDAAGAPESYQLLGLSEVEVNDKIHIVWSIR
jgi:uncharacterized protein YggE